MAQRFASEKRAFGFCDRCGFRYDLPKLKQYVVFGKIINQRVCPECWEIDHPQNWVGVIGAQKVANDPQALFNPRPDTNLSGSNGLFGWNPMREQTVNTTINSVHVTIS